MKALKRIIAIMLVLVIVLSGCRDITYRRSKVTNIVPAVFVEAISPYISIIVEDELTSDSVQDIESIDRTDGKIRRFYYLEKIVDGNNLYIYFIILAGPLSFIFGTTSNGFLFSDRELSEKELSDFKKKSGWGNYILNDYIIVDTLPGKDYYYSEEQLDAKLKGYEYLREEMSVHFPSGELMEDNGIAELRVFNKGTEDMYVAMLKYYNVEEPIYLEHHFKGNQIRAYSDWLCENYLPTWKDYVIYE